MGIFLFVRNPFEILQIVSSVWQYISICTYIEMYLYRTRLVQHAFSLCRIRRSSG